MYEVDDDLFVPPSQPPSPASLSWTGPEFDDEEGELLGTEQPVRRELKTSGTEISNWLSDARWIDVMRVLESPLFETPIAHFFVKAFLEDPLDEFVAHLTTIEAALGLESDRTSGGVTKCVKRRVSSLLGAQREGDVYVDLFNVRCAFVHGRKMDAIPSDKRVAARGLARRVVNALATAALKEPRPQSREAYLNGLR